MASRRASVASALASRRASVASASKSFGAAAWTDSATTLQRDIAKALPRKSKGVSRADSATFVCDTPKQNLIAIKKALPESALEFDEVITGGAKCGATKVENGDAEVAVVMLAPFTKTQNPTSPTKAHGVRRVFQQLSDKQISFSCPQFGFHEGTNGIKITLLDCSKDAKRWHDEPPTTEEEFVEINQQIFPNLANNAHILCTSKAAHLAFEFAHGQPLQCTIKPKLVSAHGKTLKIRCYHYADQLNYNPKYGPSFAAGVASLFAGIGSVFYFDFWKTLKSHSLRDRPTALIALEKRADAAHALYLSSEPKQETDQKKNKRKRSQYAEGGNTQDKRFRSS